MQKFNLDETTLKILELLQQNARMSYTEIGQKVGLASSSVKDRIEKLEENEIITQYTTLIDNQKLGYPIIAVTSLICSGAYTQKENIIVEMLSQYPNIMEVLRFTGNTDISVKFCAKSIEECKEITDMLGRYGKIETSFVVTSFINNSSIDISKLRKKAK